MTAASTSRPKYGEAVLPKIRIRFFTNYEDIRQLHDIVNDAEGRFIKLDRQTGAVGLKSSGEVMDSLMSEIVPRSRFEAGILPEMTAPPFFFHPMRDPVVTLWPSRLQNGQWERAALTLLLENGSGKRQPQDVTDFALELKALIGKWVERVNGVPCAPSFAADLRAGRFEVPLGP